MLDGIIISVFRKNYITQLTTNRFSVACTSYTLWKLEQIYFAQICVLDSYIPLRHNNVQKSSIISGRDKRVERSTS